MAPIISPMFSNPVTEKDNRIKMVEMINPELRMTLWNLSV